jgi:hypothetical protein
MKRIIFSVVLIAAAMMVFGQSGGGVDMGVLNRMMKYKMDGLIPLRFVDALEGKAVEGAQVVINGIGTFTTDVQGVITFPEQEDGFYTLDFSRQGFISSTIEFEVKLNNVFTNTISVSPLLKGDYIRIVLDWGQRPADLDLHLEKEGGYHISYRNMHSAADGSVVLDRDARSGYGPETITVMETELRSVYHLYIHDYSNGSRSNSTELARSGAVVRVYGRNGLLRTFYVPANLRGTRWDVFRIVNGEIAEN